LSIRNRGIGKMGYRTIREDAAAAGGCCHHRREGFALDRRAASGDRLDILEFDGRGRARTGAIRPFLVSGGCAPGGPIGLHTVI
jgi:hypothetical protein